MRECSCRRKHLLSHNFVHCISQKRSDLLLPICRSGCPAGGVRELLAATGSRTVWPWLERGVEEAVGGGAAARRVTAAAVAAAAPSCCCCCRVSSPAPLPCEQRQHLPLDLLPTRQSCKHTAEKRLHQPAPVCASLLHNLPANRRGEGIRLLWQQYRKTVQFSS